MSTRLILDLIKGNVTAEEAEALQKAKYDRRTGTPGNYKYFYDESKKPAHQTSAEKQSIDSMSGEAVEAALKQEAGHVQWHWSGPGRPVTATAFGYSDASMTGTGDNREAAGKKLLAMVRAYRAGTYDPTHGSRPYMSDPGPRGR